jgi:hypothetical protein
MAPLQQVILKRSVLCMNILGQLLSTGVPLKLKPISTPLKIVQAVYHVTSLSKYC